MYRLNVLKILLSVLESGAKREERGCFYGGGMGTTIYLNLNTEGPPLVCQGCENKWNKAPQISWLKDRKVCFSRSGVWKSEVKVLAELVSFEASLLGSQTPSAFPGCPHIAFALCLGEDFH